MEVPYSFRFVFHCVGGKAKEKKRGIGWWKVMRNNPKRNRWLWKEGRKNQRGGTTSLGSCSDLGLRWHRRRRSRRSAEGHKVRWRRLGTSMMVAVASQNHDLGFSRWRKQLDQGGSGGVLFFHCVVLAWSRGGGAKRNTNKIKVKEGREVRQKTRNGSYQVEIWYDVSCHINVMRSHMVILINLILMTYERLIKMIGRLIVRLINLDFTFKDSLKVDRDLFFHIKTLLNNLWPHGNFGFVQICFPLRGR